MTRAAPLPTALAAALLLAGGVWLWFSLDPAAGDAAPIERSATAPEADGTAAADDVSPAGAALPARETDAGTAPTPAPLRLPDGSEVPALNGVVRPAPLTWGDRPYAPIVGVVHSRGYDWYLHENGTHTTTLEVYRPDLGRFDPVTIVAHEGEPSPLDALDRAGVVHRPASGR